MKKTIIIFLILLPIYSFSQESQDYNQSCEWYYRAAKTENVGERLKIVKENFREFGSFEKDDPCRILYLISVNDKYFTLSKDSAVYYRYPDLMVNEVKEEEIDSINILSKKAVKVIYGEYIKGVVLISSSSSEYENRIYELWKKKM